MKINSISGHLIGMLSPQHPLSGMDVELLPQRSLSGEGKKG
jgi:hypothetical protein